MWGVADLLFRLYFVCDQFDALANCLPIFPDNLFNVSKLKLKSVQLI
jgi:hypothetical protein